MLRRPNHCLKYSRKFCCTYWPVESCCFCVVCYPWCFCVVCFSDYVRTPEQSKPNTSEESRIGWCRFNACSTWNGVNAWSCLLSIILNLGLHLLIRDRLTLFISLRCLKPWHIPQKMSVFVFVFQKTVRSEFIYYGIEDRTGRMEVVVYGQFTKLYCEPGDKLRLVCFELSSSLDMY